MEFCVNKPMENNLGALVHIMHIAEIKSELVDLDEFGSDKCCINGTREKAMLYQMRRDGMHAMVQRLVW